MLQLPTEILAYTGRISAAERQWIGENSFVYILDAECGRFVLKMDGRPAQVALREREARILAALREHTPFVPQLVACAGQDGQTSFLFTYVEGENLVDALQSAGRAERFRLLGAYGQALRRVHGWMPDLPRPQDWLGDSLATVARHIAEGTRSGPIAADSAYDGRDARQLGLELIARWGEVTNDTVFCHGDYCLPNVLVRGSEVTGVIDWPHGGYADRRYDLATALWSIMFNLHDRDYARPFLEGYGYTEPLASLEYFEALYVLL